MNKIRYGLENLHIAFVNGDGTYDTPIRIPGVVGFSSTPEGSEVEFYADNIKYYTRYANNGYTGDIETALFPDEVISEMQGWEFDANGMLVEDADGAAKEFALLGQVQGDQANRRFIYFRCSASRPATSHATQTENIEPTTETLNVTMMPLVVGDRKFVKGVIERNESNATVYDNFFDAVLMPEFTVVP